MPPKKTKTSSKKTKKDSSKKPAQGYSYPLTGVEEFSWSDWAKVRIGSMGLFISFGQMHPETGQFQIVKEILMPLNVAFAFKDLIADQLNKAVELGYIKFESEDEKD